MMRFIAATFLTALLAYASALFLPWWVIAPAAFTVAVCIPQSSSKTFLSGFTGLFVLWGLQTIIIDAHNNHVLATRIAGVLPLGGSYIALIFVTAFVGGLVGGLAAITGSFLHPITHRRTSTVQHINKA